MELPEITIKPTPLFDLQYGAIRSWLLITAVEYKVFNLTAEKRTAIEIAAAIKAHEANTELFLNALCALDLLKKENGKFINTEMSDNFLVEGRETYIGGTLLLNEQWNLESKTQLKALIKNGPQPVQEQPDYSGNYFADYVNDMRNLSRSGQSQIIAKEISKLPEFSNMKKMLELGGAHGMDSIATIMKSPALKGVVFDKPAVVENTRRVIAEYQMEDRVSVMGGITRSTPSVTAMISSMQKRHSIF